MPVTPDALLQIALAFLGSKTLLSAVELGLFTELAEGPADARGAARAARPAPAQRARLPRRAGRAGHARARATAATATRPATDLFLDRAKPSYIGGMLEMANARLYGFWGRLTEAPAHRRAAERGQGAAATFRGALRRPGPRCGSSSRAMTGLSARRGAGDRREVPLGATTSTFVDVGAPQGGVPVQVALAHPAPDRRRLRPAGGRAGLRGVRRGSRPARPRSASPRATSSRTRCPRPTCW